MKYKLAMFFEAEDGKKYLLALINRKNDKLDLAGGDESIEEELLQETGLKLKKKDHYSEWGKSKENKTLYYIGFFRLKILEKIKKNFEAQDFEEHKDIVLIDLDEIKKIKKKEDINKHTKWAVEKVIKEDKKKAKKKK